MKYLSLLILISFLSVSWSMVHKTVALSEVTHQDIQKDFKRFITEYISKGIQDSKDIEFHRMWTERLTDTKVKISFTYSFKDSDKELGTTDTKITGFAILNKEVTTEEGPVENWLMDELHISNNHLVFEKGIDFNSDEEAEEVSTED